MKLKIQIQLKDDVVDQAVEPDELAPIDPRKVLTFSVLLAIPAIFFAFYFYITQTPPIAATPIVLAVEQPKEPVEAIPNKPPELVVQQSAAVVTVGTAALTSSVKATVGAQEHIQQPAATIIPNSVTIAGTTEAKLNSNLPALVGGSADKPKKLVVQKTQTMVVARLILTSGIKNREPVDDLGTKIDGNLEQTIYVFSDIRNMAGQRLTHRWLLNGREVAKINLAIGGIRWRTYSRKTITPEMVGQWRIELLNSDGDLLTSHKFDYYH